MTVYENQHDREKQTNLANRLRHLYQNLPFTFPGFTIEETPHEDLDHHDFEVFREGNFFAVGEAKRRTGNSGIRYDTAFFRRFDWAIGNDRLRYLWVEHYKKGRQVVLFLETLDGDVFFVDLSVVLQAWKNKTLKPAPPGSMKDDHGTKPTNKKGVLIPFKLLTALPETKQ